LGAGIWAYFSLWLPEIQRAKQEQLRTSQLEREQTEHEARQKEAEKRAKDELLQAMSAAAARDAGTPAAVDAGAVPRGALEARPPDGPQVPAPSLPASAIAPRADSADGAASFAPPTAVPRAGPQTFGEWMAEATRRRTHERSAGALAAYDRALSLKPGSAEAHTGRGLALLDLGRRHEAVVEFHRALELDPHDGVAVLGLAEGYRSLGRIEEESLKE
jgi:tetratricopeptide (TPR) repeat protein